MTGRRTLVLGVVAWLVVVVAGAGLVWAVISRAGEGVASSAQPDVGGPASTRTTSPQPEPQPETEPEPDPGATSREPRGQQGNRRTWQGAAGHVTVACDGGAASLPSAGPNPGWRIEIDDTGPDEVRVEFEVGDGEGGVRVEAVCRSGAPVFEVDAD